MVDNVKKITITLNRACNLRCSWCYARDTKFDPKNNISFETFNKIIDFAKTAKVNRISLIGGEPTMFPDILKYIKILNGFKLSIISNGIKFADEKVVREYKEAGLKNISISIKAKNAIEYKTLTGANEFERVLLGINNLIKNNIHVSVSYVLTEANIDGVKEMVDTVKKTGCNNFFFSFCRNFEEKEGDHSFIFNNNPLVVSRKFEELLPWLEDNIEHLSYSINDPLCIYSDDFIEKNLTHIFFPCYIHTNMNLVFDTDGTLIPCNTIHQIGVGKIGDDFKTYDEYLEYTKTEKYISLYKQLRGYPSLKCKDCKLFINCQGRCVCNWTNYSFETLEKLKLTDHRFSFSIDSFKTKHSLYNSIINEITSFDENKIRYPEKFSVIIGVTKYKKYKNICLSSNTPYNYLTNGNVAFFTRNSENAPSLINILTLLTCSYDISLELIDFLRKNKCVEKFVKFLCYKGYLFVNIEDIAHYNKFNDLIKKSNNILVCGKKDYFKRKGYLNEFETINNLVLKLEVPSLIMPHPSGNNISLNGFIDAWLYHDNYSAAVSTFSEKHKKVSLIQYIL